MKQLAVAAAVAVTALICVYGTHRPARRLGRLPRPC
jgi:hypothetical protein